MEKERYLSNSQIELNKELGNILQKHGVKNIRMTSIGNSIASGYSMVRTIKPLLLRNATISDILKEMDINLDVHHYARAQNNSDEHIFEWVEGNIKESEIHRMNRSDYSKEQTSMPSHITKEKIDEYYPETLENDLGLKDAILESNDNLANIVVYNGATGSFLDGLTRHGSLKQQMLHGVKRDIDNIESTLKIIQTNNRLGKSNTQVYLCGAPNFKGLGLSSIINRRLKKVCKNFANVVYVEPVKSKFVYNNMDEQGNDIEGRSVDIHYDEEEYVEFNNNIIKAINENYETSKSLVELDRELYTLNRKIELEDKELVSDSDKKKELVTSLIKRRALEINDAKDRKVFLVRLGKYIKERFPYDFVYLGKKEVNSSIKSQMK